MVEGGFGLDEGSGFYSPSTKPHLNWIAEIVPVRRSCQVLPFSLDETKRDRDETQDPNSLFLALIYRGHSEPSSSGIFTIYSSSVEADPRRST